MFKFLLIPLALLSLSTPLLTHAEVTKEEVQFIVRDYIRDNGAELLAAIAHYEQERQHAAASASIARHTPTVGPKDAAVTVIEFSDFECPFCGRAQATLQEVRRRYEGRIRFAYKHLPLDFHPQALPAAKASQAAHNQGKFWEFSKEMWARQDYLGEKLFVDVAKELELDLEQFNQDRASKEIAAQVARDLRDAERVQARGTPFFLINGTPVSGAQPLDVFIETIEAAMRAIDTPPSKQ